MRTFPGLFIESEVNAASSTSMADTALGWAGWAVTSLTSKLYHTSSTKTMLESTPSQGRKFFSDLHLTG